MVLSIELENNVWVFAPGENITGKVVIDKGIWNKVEGLTIRFYGKLEVGSKTNVVRGPPTLSHPPAAQSSTTASSTLPLASMASTTTTNFTSGSEHGCLPGARKFIGRKDIHAEQVILDHTINLLDTWRVLKPGRHEFNFDFCLPTSAHLPPSLKISGARIHYEFVTSLKRPRDDYKIYQTPFYITSSSEEYDEEDFVEFCAPAIGKVERRLPQLFGCCMNGNISLNVELIRRIFPIGGNVTFVVSVRNNLRSNLDAVKADLIRKFKYKKSPSWSTKEIVSNVIGPILQPGESQVWNGSLRIPNIETATNRFYHDFFEITHFLQFQVCGSNHRSKDATIKFSLMLLPVSVFSELLTRPCAPIYLSIVEDDDSLPPPTYDEAITDSSCFSEDQRSTSQLMPS